MTGRPRPFALLLLFAMLAGCATPRLQERSEESQPPRLSHEAAVMADGYRLPLRRWGDPREAQAMVLALHGFNDYGNAFADLGAYLADQAVLTYAYDQRGFGATDQRGRWAGEERIISDLRIVTRLLRQRHPDLPLYLLGESMGGAVVMVGAAGTRGADGVILVAPAVWSRETMNPLQRFALWITAYTVPWLELTGRGLDIRPSDNQNMLRAFSADPLVIKATRVDALWGVTNLMDRAAATSGRLAPPALLLYGEQDEIIPKRAFCATLGILPEHMAGLRLVLYRNGWHMLTRDLQGERVMADIATWVRDSAGSLPSGEEAAPGSARLERFCASRRQATGASRPNRDQ